MEDQLYGQLKSFKPHISWRYYCLFDRYRDSPGTTGNGITEINGGGTQTQTHEM